MTSKSCIKLVQLYFDRIDNIEIETVKMGEVRLEIKSPEISIGTVKKYFSEIGFEVIEDPDSICVEKVKQAAIELIHLANNTSSLIRNSDYISQRMQLPYDKISKLFSKVTGTTLEKYIILLKIEKAKELLMGEAYTVSEISYMLGYSSIQYLSNQFKKTTGITISEFKENPKFYRIPLEDLLPEFH